MSLDVIVSTHDFSTADEQLSRWDTAGGPHVEPSHHLASFLTALREAVEDADVFAVSPAEQVFDPDGVLVTLSAASYDDYQLVLTVAWDHGYRAYDPEGHDLQLD